MNYLLYENGPSRDLAIKPRRSNENGVEKGIWAVIDSIPHIICGIYLFFSNHISHMGILVRKSDLKNAADSIYTSRGNFS